MLEPKWHSQYSDWAMGPTTAQSMFYS